MDELTAGSDGRESRGTLAAALGALGGALIGTPVGFGLGFLAFRAIAKTGKTDGFADALGEGIFQGGLGLLVAGVIVISSAIAGASIGAAVGVRASGGSAAGRTALATAVTVPACLVAAWIILAILPGEPPELATAAIQFVAVGVGGALARGAAGSRPTE